MDGPEVSLTATQPDKLEKVYRSFLKNNYLPKIIQSYANKGALEARCYNLSFNGKVYCPAFRLTSHA